MNRMEESFHEFENQHMDVLEHQKQEEKLEVKLEDFEYQLEINELEEFHSHEQEKFNTLRFHHLVQLEAELQIKCTAKREIAVRTMQCALSKISSELHQKDEETDELLSSEKELVLQLQLTNIERDRLTSDQGNFAEMYRLLDGQYKSLKLEQTTMSAKFANSLEPKIRNDFRVFEEARKNYISKFSNQSNTLEKLLTEANFIEIDHNRQTKEPSEFEKQSEELQAIINNASSETDALETKLKESNQLSLNLAVNKSSLENEVESIRIDIDDLKTQETANESKFKEALVNFDLEKLKLAEKEFSDKDRLKLQQQMHLEETQLALKQYEDRIEELKNKEQEEQVTYKSLESTMKNKLKDHETKIISLQEEVNASNTQLVDMERKICLLNEEEKALDKIIASLCSGLNSVDLVSNEKKKLRKDIEERIGQRRNSFEELKKQNLDSNTKINEVKVLLNQKRETLKMEEEKYKTSKNDTDKKVSFLKEKLEQSKRDLEMNNKCIEDKIKNYKDDTGRALIENNETNKVTLNEMANELQPLEKQVREYKESIKEKEKIIEENKENYNQLLGKRNKLYNSQRGLDELDETENYAMKKPTTSSSKVSFKDSEERGTDNSPFSKFRKATQGFSSAEDAFAALFSRDLSPPEPTGNDSKKRRSNLW